MKALSYEEKLSSTATFSKNDINFILCYPIKKDLNEYVKRFRKRGNTEKYIQMKLKQYDEKIKLFESLKQEKIVLTQNQTLENYLKDHNFELKNK